MSNPFDVQKIAAGLCDQPRHEALSQLNELLTWTDERGSEANVAHMEFSVRLVTSVRRECESRRQPPPWA